MGDENGNQPTADALTPEALHRSAVIKIWTTVGLVSTYINGNILVFTQGGHLFFPAPVPEDVSPYAAAIYGSWIGGPLFLGFLWLCLYYAKRIEAAGWATRFPVAFDLPLLPGDRLTLWYQRFFLFAFVFVPLYSQIHFLRKTLNGTVKARDTGSVVANDWSSHLFRYADFLPIFTDGNAYRFDEHVTFFPFWQPWLTVIFCAGILWVTIQFVRALRSPPPKT